MVINWGNMVNPVTEDWIMEIRQAEDVFEKKVRENPEVILQGAYSEFQKFLFDNYLNDKHREKYPALFYICDEWYDIVNLPVCELIDVFVRRNTISSGDFSDQIIKKVKMTSRLFKTWLDFGDKGKQSLLDIFQMAIDLAQINNTHRIVVLGQELLSEIGNIQVGHKTANFTLVSTLLENAQKYSPEGSIITVEISKEYYQTISSITGKKIGKKYYKYYVSVADEGIGIPTEDQERVLVEGQRGSNVGDIPGTGFGLHLVYQLCNWQVTIESPLYPEKEKYKGTKIKAELYNW